METRRKNQPLVVGKISKGRRGVSPRDFQAAAERGETPRLPCNPRRFLSIVGIKPEQSGPDCSI
jgi:hypothetical protein